MLRGLLRDTFRSRTLAQVKEKGKRPTQTRVIDEDEALVTGTRETARCVHACCTYRAWTGHTFVDICHTEQQQQTFYSFVDFLVDLLDTSLSSLHV